MPLAQPISVPSNAAVPNRYGVLRTQIYDRDKLPGSLPDVRFYLGRLAGTEGPILEAAVGTGRLLIPLLEAGLEVEGFDHLKPGGRPLIDLMPGADHQPGRRSSRSSRILNFEAQRPA